MSGPRGANPHYDSDSPFLYSSNAYMVFYWNFAGQPYFVSWITAYINGPRRGPYPVHAVWASCIHSQSLIDRMLIETGRGITFVTGRWRDLGKA